MTLGDWLRTEAKGLSGEPVPLGWLAQRLDEALPGAALIVAALPSVLPIPGIGNITGVALMILALTLARGMPRPAFELPARLAAVKLPDPQVQRLLRWLAALFDWAGCRLRPRWAPWVSDRAWTFASLPVGVMGVVIFLPIPLGNVLGTVALVSIGFGQCLRDGVWVALGWMFSILTLAYCAALGMGALALGKSLWIFSSACG